MICIQNAIPAEPDETITLTTGSHPVHVTTHLLRSIQQAAHVKIVQNGQMLLFGTPPELAALSFDSPGLAGEHPIERSMRLLTGSPTLYDIGSEDR